MADAATLVMDFFAQYRTVEFEKRDIIIQTDTSPDGVYYLVSGQVRQYDISPTGEEVVVNMFQPPAFFPMGWAINSTPNVYVFEAFTDVVAHKAPPEHVVDLLHRHPEITFDLLARVYRGTDGLQRRMVYLMENNALKRLLFELVMSAERFGENRPSGEVLVAMHEGELAARVGLARETASRVLRAIKRRGLLTITPAGLVVHDLAAVKKVLDRANAK